MKLNSNAQSAIQKNLSESLVLQTSQQETAPVEIKAQPLQQGPVQVAHALPMISLATPDDLHENPIIYIVAVYGLELEIGKRKFGKAECDSCIKHGFKMRFSLTVFAQRRRLRRVQPSASPPE